jgi:4-diphosphocytidyl-2-C-methyl-D-erythritol kinase
MTNLSITAPAKINLFLHVVGQRSDGYHLLQSVFQLIDLSDEVILSRREDGDIIRQNPLPNISPESDLVVRAAKLLQTFSKTRLGANIDLIKNIPIGAGLGGGSSDAASTLLGLNRLWELDLSTATLMHLGLQLGADVPFFIHGQNAFVEGVGDKIQVMDLTPKNYLIIYPGVAISTQAIFSDPYLTRDHSAITIMDFTERFPEANLFKNDLQDVVVRNFLEVKTAIEWLENYFPDTQVTMSGSGSSVFCEIPNSNDGHERLMNCMLNLPKRWQGYKVRSLSRHSAYNLISTVN